MKREERHQIVLKNLEQKYLDQGVDKSLEFIWDGPSYWNKYENSDTPRIVFLAMESHSSFHPSIPFTIKGKFGINIAKWAATVLDIDKSRLNKFSKNLQEAYDTIAIVEVKKIDEDKQTSFPADIKKYAWMGREYLKEQLEILNPQIIICCGTLEYFDIIYNYSHEEYRQLERVIYENKKLKCWVSDNKLVVQFYHPSARVNSDKMAECIKDFVNNDVVQLEYLEIISKQKYSN